MKQTNANSVGITCIFSVIDSEQVFSEICHRPNSKVYLFIKTFASVVLEKTFVLCQISEKIIFDKKFVKLSVLQKRNYQRVDFTEYFFQ